MAERISWDKFEIALLIEACEHASTGSPKQEIVKDLSAKLRVRAVSRGQEIDELFRNENGIALQMNKMDYLLTDGKKGLPGASKFFAEMVALKRTSPAEFSSILRSAKQQINEERDGNVKVTNKRSEFVGWINKQGKLKVHPNGIVSVLDESSEYAQKHGITKVSFWEMEDSATFVSAYRKLSVNKLFRVFKRNTAQTLDKVFGYYKDFLDSVAAIETAVITPAVIKMNTEAEVAINSDDSVRANNPDLYDKVYSALRDLSKEKNCGVSVLSVHESSGGSLPEIKTILDQVTWAKADGKQYRFVGISPDVEEARIPVSETPVAELPQEDNSDNDVFSEKEKSVIIHKLVDKSLLVAGLTVPKAVSDELMQKMGISLAKGEACEITVYIGKTAYQAKVISVNFSEKYSDVEMLQIRYTASSPLCRRINEMFEDPYKNGVKAYLDIIVVGERQLEFVASDASLSNIPHASKNSTDVSVKANNDYVVQSDNIEDGFVAWMQKKGMAEATVRSYASSVRSAQQYARKNGIEGVHLNSNDTSIILNSIDILLANKSFFKYNQEQHNRFSAAFRKLRDYITELNRKNGQKSNDVALEMLYPELYHKLYSVSKIYDDPQGLTLDRIESIIGIKGAVWQRNNIIEILDGVSWATKITDNVYTFSKRTIVQIPVVEKTITEDVEPNDYDKEAFIRVLMSRYQSGMQFDSIDLENFRNTYEDMYDERLSFSDEELEVRLKCCGILYKDRLFPVEGIIDNCTKERLFAYIENKFAVGNKVLYYKAIFSDLADAFSYCFSLTDEQMLKAYIEHTAEKGKYYFHSDFMSTEKDVKIDHSAEIENFLLAAGKPLSYDEVYEGLSHISKDIIYREIRSGSNFLMNARECYFHINIFEFSDSDGDRIAEIFNKEIDENGYVIWSKVYDSVKEQMPIFIENNLYLSPLGIRNALSRLMADRFDFDGEVISTHGSHLGMADVFRLYAKHNTPFSDTDLYTFAKATDTTIYFWALAEESVRVSKNLFVAKDQVEFDVEATDKALETYLSSGYILVKDVDSFLVFPNVGYEWNEFLLESYLLHYSEKFCLVNNGTSLNNVAGAVAKKDGKFTQFVDICAQALADSGIELKKTAALNYLAEINLITRRSYKELDVAMTKARQIRNRKG